VKKSLFSASLVLSLFSLGTLVHAAAYTNGDAFWTGGYDNRSVYDNIKYYVASDVETSFGKFIDDAISDYSSISGVDFGFSETTDFLDADLMIFNTKEGSAYHGVPGVMVPCDWSGSSCNKVAYESYWDAATILLFPDYMRNHGYSDKQKNKTVVHEFGHVFSLRHQDDPSVSSVMVAGEGNSLTSPTSLDISNLQWKY